MIGTSVQRYEILEELGQGGMSVVYLGQDTALDRKVAVKVLHSHLARKEENRERFRREAQAIARLQHENIVDVYDYSREEDDESYIVMEYVPGDNLRTFCDRHGHPPPEVAAMIAAIIADALTHAHEHGVIHRDLKPENVMVSEDGRITLMDFGIAHVADAETMTQTGSLLGSPAHMAPEIIDGKDVNIRSDIFSLGTVLYWLATGEFPFSGDSAPQLLRQVLECNYDPPDSVEPKLSRELCHILDRCLARDPEDRFESVRALREALADSLGVLGEDVDIHAELASYLKEPDAYVEDFEDTVVDKLVDEGHRRMEKGQIPRAIALFNRVLAYDPNNTEVEGALDELEESTVTPGAIVAVVVALAVVGTTLWFTLLRTSPPGDAATGAANTIVDRAVARGRSRAGVRSADALGRGRGGVVRAHASKMALQTRARRCAEAVGDRARRVAERMKRDAPVPVALGQPSRVTPPSVEGPEPDGRPQSADGEPQDNSETGEAPENPEEQPPKTFEYRFKVSPLAATVYIDGRQMSAPEAMRGVELTRGTHHIRAVSQGCHPYERTFTVDGPRSERMAIALEWKDASLRVVSNRPAVVYLDGDTSKPYPIGANGKNAQIRIPFGKVDPDRNTSSKDVTLEISPRDNLQIVRKRTVSLRPGDRSSIRVNFSFDSAP